MGTEIRVLSVDILFALAIPLLYTRVGWKNF